MKIQNHTTKYKKDKKDLIGSSKQHQVRLWDTILQLLLSNKWHVVIQLINIWWLIYIKPSFWPSYVLFQLIGGRVALSPKSAWKNGESPHH